MYQIGDYIIFGNKGVCRIEDIGSLESLDMPKDVLYYTLNPIHTKGSRVFTPVDNDKVVVRPVLTKEEANQLIDQIHEIDCLWVPDEKRREREYKEAFKTCDPKELVKIIKTIYIRKESRENEGKKTTALDGRYFKMAEDSLYGELAISLSMELDKVKAHLIERVESLIE